MSTANQNASLGRLESEQIAEAAVTKFALMHPELTRVKAEIPAPLKWAGGVISALLISVSGAMAIWLFTTVSSMQVTLARMDERQLQVQNSQDGRYASLDARLTKIEGYFREPISIH